MSFISKLWQYQKVDTSAGVSLLGNFADMSKIFFIESKDGSLVILPETANASVTNKRHLLVYVKIFATGDS